ncbi:MAG: hypothetical protein JXA07_13055 [Spirochaetes bacterium]|nr:hypothetical protein [Spirochaetota bacterium]
MKKCLSSLSAVLLLIASIACSGCGNESDNGGLELLPLLSSGSNSVSGSPANIAAAGAAVTGITGTLTSFQSQVMESGGGSASIAKNFVENNVLPDVKARVADRMAAITAGCDGSVQAINDSFTGVYSEEGLTVEPDLTVTGTYQCTTNSDGSTTTRYVINLLGSITTVFTDKTVCVFGVDDYVNNGNYNFVEQTLNGTVTVDSIHDSMELSMTMLSETEGSVQTSVMTMSGSGSSSSHASSSGLSVDGADPVSFDLIISNTSSSSGSMTYTYNTETHAFSLDPMESTGTQTHSINGTVNGGDVFIHYRFNADDYKEYIAALNETSCSNSNLGTATCTIDGAEKTYEVNMVVLSADACMLIGSTPGGTLDNMEMLSIYMGDGSVGDHNLSSIMDNEYISYMSMADSIMTSLFGLTAAYGGSSTIHVDVNDDSAIEGTFSGTVCESGGTNCKVITDGQFTARKPMMSL